MATYAIDVSDVEVKTWLIPFLNLLIRNGDTILFTHEGGVDVGDVDAKT